MGSAAGRAVPNRIEGRCQERRGPGTSRSWPGANLVPAARTAERDELAAQPAAPDHAEWRDEAKGTEGETRADCGRAAAVRLHLCHDILLAEDTLDPDRCLGVHGGVRVWKHHARRRGCDGLDDGLSRDRRPLPIAVDCGLSLDGLLFLRRGIGWFGIGHGNVAGIEVIGDASAKLYLWGMRNRKFPYRGIVLVV